MKKVILVLPLCCVLILSTVNKKNRVPLIAQLGWKATKAAGGGEGLQWGISGAAGYAGSVAGGWAAVQAGALIGTSVGPVGTFIGGLIGAGIGAY